MVNYNTKILRRTDINLSQTFLKISRERTPKTNSIRKFHLQYHQQEKKYYKIT